MHVAATSMKIGINRLMVDPEFYLFNCSEDTESSEFLIVTEKLLEIAPFIDIRLQPHARGQFTIPTRELAELVRHSPTPRPQQHFIFHHAFVCSTLLARCLSQSEAFFSLKEPHIIRRLADLRRSEHQLAGKNSDLLFGPLLSTHLKLLAKNYSRGEKVVVKATNVANNLIPDISRQFPDCRLLYMFCSLEQFLVSNLKKTTETREKIPALFRITAGDFDFYQRYPVFRETAGLNFLQYCTLLWLASNHNFLRQAESLPSQQFATLSMQDFLAAPRDVLDCTSRLFGHDANGAELDSMTSDAIMRRHAKDPNLSYDNLTRERENAAIRLRYGKEIAQAIRWLQPFCAQDKIHAELDGYSVLSGLPSPDRALPGTAGLQSSAVRISSHN